MKKFITFFLAIILSNSAFADNNISDLVENIMWEPARNGELFPHYYGFLETNFAQNIYPIELGADGIHKFPKNFFS